MGDRSEGSMVKGVLRKAMSGHLGLHRITTIQKYFKANEIKRGVEEKDKYAKIARKFKMLEHSVTLEDDHGDEDNENKKVEQTIYYTAFRSIVVLFTYFSLGVLALHFIDGHMSLFDILYFLVVTLTTIGYGDISPSNKYSKIFVSIYTICGLMMFSTALSGMLRYWFQQQEKHYRKQVLDRLSEEDCMNDPHSGKEDEEEDNDDNDSEEGEEGKIHIEGGDGDTHCLDMQAQQQIEMEMGTRRKSTLPFALPAGVAGAPMSGAAAAAHIYAMTDKVSRYFVEKLKIPPFAVPIIKDLIRSVFLIFVNISLGTLCYYLLQDDAHANFSDAFYLTMSTITTVGYGDVVPSTQGARYFTVFYACVGTLFTANCVLKFNHAITNYHKQHRQDIILRSEFSLKSFFDMDSDGDNEVTKEEFLLYKILHMNLVDADIIARIERQFNAWDVDGSGTLTPADIEIMSRVKQGEKKARPNLLNMSKRRGGNGSTNSLEGIYKTNPRHFTPLSRSQSLGADSGSGSDLGAYSQSDRYRPQASSSSRPLSKSLDRSTFNDADTHVNNISPVSSSSSAKIHPMMGTTGPSTVIGTDTSSTDYYNKPTTGALDNKQPADDQTLAEANKNPAAAVDFNDNENDDNEKSFVKVFDEDS